MLSAFALASGLLFAHVRSPLVGADVAATTWPLQMVNVTFLTPLIGWRLAVRWDENRGLYGPVSVGQTANGGLTWRTLGIIPNGTFRQGGEESLRVSDILFASPRDGWVYGSALYSTHDGGRAWKRLPIRGGQTSLSAAGRSAWRLDTRCAGQDCRAIALVSTMGSDHWQRAPWQPPASWTTSASLFRADAVHAWLLSGELMAPSNRLTDRLLATDDGGRTWHALPIPCATQGPVGDVLAAYGPHHLWAFCASEPGAGNQWKAVDRSDNGGKSWRLVSATDQHGLRNLPAGGYVREAALTSPSNAWLALGRGTLMHTADGGRTWRAAIPYAEANPLDGGVGPIMFVDPRHGWLLSFPNLLFRTVDGGRTWEKIQLP